MNVRSPTAPRARWRDRFVEIARQVETDGAAHAAGPVAGLRLRARIHGARLLAQRMAGAKVEGIGAG